eukprot:TRINITY_DN20573_c0_g1_i1.p1 TRINITY_DN20573_c0_g1~~TRINITY_DN20573_c0_g1_i1.p1  ORF type:complete len:353 (+),score=66.66 TRINITY_DN20573_c0_g1_i1:144-1202(+)
MAYADAGGWNHLTCEIGSTRSSSSSARPSRLTSKESLPAQGVPGAVEIKRLLKIKVAQEERLQSVRARIGCLSAHDQRVWKDVKVLQQREMVVYEAQWRRQNQQAEIVKLHKDVIEREEALRERARRIRTQLLQSKTAPRMAVIEQNKAAASQIREDSKRLMAALQDVREQSRQSKAMQVEVRRQQQRQRQLRKELEGSRKEQTRQEINALRYAEIQEDIQVLEDAIADAENEELAAVSRMQNFQSVRSCLWQEDRATSPRKAAALPSERFQPPSRATDGYKRTGVHRRHSHSANGSVSNSRPVLGQIVEGIEDASPAMCEYRDSRDETKAAKETVTEVPAHDTVTLSNPLE